MLLARDGQIQNNTVLVWILRGRCKGSLLDISSLIWFSTLHYFRCQHVGLPLECHAVIYHVQICAILKDDGAKSQELG